MKILFNYPSRSRPELFRRGIEGIVNNAVGQYEILAIVDSDDPTLKDYSFEHCTFVHNGLSKSKVDAINRGKDYILNSDCDIIVNMSDDMVFTKGGFDIIIWEAFVKTLDGSPLVVDLDQCIHFPDGTANEKLMTMSIMGREYYKRFNYIYHPDYMSLYCDNEAMEVAKILGKYKYVDTHIFKHLHPANGNAPNDPQYVYTESFHPIDSLTYQRRKHRNFGL